MISGYANRIFTQPANKIPGMGNINGYFESRVDSGYINLSSDKFTFFPRTIYDNPVEFDQIHSQIAWNIWPEDNRVVINSGQIAGEGDFGQANGFFFLDLPWIQDSRKSDFTLHIGLANSATEYYEQFVPNKVSASLRQWLSRSIKKGKVPQAGLIYRGGFSDNNARAIQLFVDVEDAELAYSDEWPNLSHADAKIIVDNRSLNVTSDRATVFDEEIDSLEVSWPHGPKGLLLSLIHI